MTLELSSAMLNDASRVSTVRIFTVQSLVVHSVHCVARIKLLVAHLYENERHTMIQVIFVYAKSNTCYDVTAVCSIRLHTLTMLFDVANKDTSAALCAHIAVAKQPHQS